ncbi:MAG: hypothetical protein ACLGGX_05515 [Bdellovibrionia bacterium]
MDKNMMKLKWDVRMIEKNLQTGVITKEEYEKHLKELPDLSNNVEQVDLENSDDEGQIH